MWKNVVEPDKSQVTILTRRMRFACRITKARLQTHIHNT